ncbi:MAG: cytochrome C biogenesis protein [Oscillospiraceae bacterium]|nr:cytochrome C biogenesis protein [Oscillospiraceae bacterium]
MFKLEIFIPAAHFEALREALRSAGAGASEKYDGALNYSPVKGCWRPLAGANPYHGEVGVLCEADEYKVEVRCPIEKLEETVKAIRAVHPYEEPVINVIPLVF